MMDLQTLRINRTPVSENRKCESCVHYDGNAAAKGGACEVGTSPALCGNGSEPKYGYAALTDLSPDEIDDLATPLVTGPQGSMNEHGDIEKMIVMKRVCLGDEDLSIAQRIHGELTSYLKKSWGYAQGEVNMFSGAELAQQRTEQPEYPMVQVAKSLHDMYLSPRKQHKYGVTDVLVFLQSRGMPVTEEEMAICKSRFGATRQVPVGHADNPTLPQAASSLHAYNSATRAPGGMGSQTPSAPVAAKPRQRSGTPTQQMSVMKAAPNVTLVKGTLTASERNKIKSKNFALPEKREYPIEDKGHAVAAESRAEEFASPSEEKRIDAAVHRKYPDLGKSTGGEGSRGGHIIGHTSSGEPIYAPTSAYPATARRAANDATIAAHNVSRWSHIWSKKGSNPKHWDPEAHRHAAKLHEIAAAHHRHALAEHEANPPKRDPDGTFATHQQITHELRGDEEFHRGQAAQHHYKAAIAEAVKHGDKHTAEYEASELHGLASPAWHHHTKQILEHVQRMPSKKVQKSLPEVRRIG